jgi:ribonuclease HII
MLSKYIDDLEVGIDEAGRGSLLGRVYAGAVIWDSNIQNENIKDSKKISKKKRVVLCDWIKSNSIAWGVGWAEASEIDEINILEATKIAMTRAIDNLKLNFNVNFDTIIIDGIGWENKFTNYNVHSLVKGDNKLYSIAAASILAKVYHDNHITELCNESLELDNNYNLLNNMGYGTKKHIDGIHKYGKCIYHRNSFLKKIDIYTL